MQCEQGGAVTCPLSNQEKNMLTSQAASVKYFGSANNFSARHSVDKINHDIFVSCLYEQLHYI